MPSKPDQLLRRVKFVNAVDLKSNNGDTNNDRLDSINDNTKTNKSNKRPNFKKTLSTGSYIPSSANILENNDNELHSTIEFDETGLIAKHNYDTNLNILNHDDQNVNISVSTSRYNLQQIVIRNNWQQLNTFNLWELRDGFFEPVYTRPDNHTFIANSLNNNTISKNTKHNINCFFIKIWFKKLLYFSKNYKQLYSKYFINDNTKLINNRIFKYNMISMFKNILALILSTILIVIHPIGTWLGHHNRILFPMAVLICHPDHNIGLQTEMTIQSLSGGFIAIAWSSFAWFLSTCTNTTRKYPGGILFGSFFLSMFIIIWIRSFFERSMYFSITAGVGLIYFHTVSLPLIHYLPDTMNWQLYRDFALSWTFGVLLSWFISVLIFPRTGHSDIKFTMIDSIDQIKQFFICLIDYKDMNNDEKLFSHKESLLKQFNVTLPNCSRDWSNQFLITKFNNSKNDNYPLLSFRKQLTKFETLLRILPTDQKNCLLSDSIFMEDIINHIEQDNLDDDTIQFDIDNDKDNSILTTEQLLKEIFGRHTLLLISQLINSTETLDCVLKSGHIPSSSNTNDKEDTEEKKTTTCGDIIEASINSLEKQIQNIDYSYKCFTKKNSKNLVPDSIKNEEIIDTLLFIKTIRNTARSMIELLNISKNLKTKKWNFYLPNYSWKGALHILPDQFSIDAGLGNTLNFTESQNSLNNIFEDFYNTYTSSNPQYKRSDKVFTRAVDHKDFSYHKTKQSIWRYQLWLIARLLHGPSFTWAFKVTFMLCFTALPAWLNQSFNWYEQYQCYYAVILLYIVLHKDYFGNSLLMFKRFFMCLFGIFWGWASCQAYHFNSPYVISVFAFILIFACGLNRFIFNDSLSSFVSLYVFFVISLESYSSDGFSNSTKQIWQNTWITGLSLLIGILISISTSLFIFAFPASRQLDKSISTFISHLSQLFQSVTDRYLYRDINDNPTNLTVKLSHIWEVRLTQSLFTLKDLLSLAQTEFRIVPNFNYDNYENLINLLSFILEEIIESRVSGSFFEVWSKEFMSSMSSEELRSLLSLRRNSVSSIIFNLYIVSECFKSKNKIPEYLPNPILSRKILFDYLLNLKKRHLKDKQLTNLKKDLIKKQISNTSNAGKEGKNEWRDLHRLELSKAYTNIAKGVYLLIDLSKDILGEETF